MNERPYSRYTREKTWAALYHQHINACYALVPYSATNNSIAVIRCPSPEETQAMMRELLTHAEEWAAYYRSEPLGETMTSYLAKARHAVVLARSHDYYHYRLADHTELALVICGLHDSYLPLPVWEMRTNRRYGSRETAIPLVWPDFERVRRTHIGHSILLAAYAEGDKTATAYVKELPPRTQRRMKREKDAFQDTRYRGRPLAFLTEAERSAIGNKIAAGLRRYYEQKRQKAV